MDLYFKRHDGCAVTCDDFLAAMADANNEDLSGLARWYGQAGTPNLKVTLTHDAAAGTATLTARQSTPPTPGQANKVPVLIPIAVGLLGADGAELPLRLQVGFLPFRVSASDVDWGVELGLEELMASAAECLAGKGAAEGCCGGFYG